MRNELMALVFSLLCFPLFGQNDSDNFEGQWKTEKESIVSISKKGMVFTGKLMTKDAVVVKNLHFEDGEWQCVLIRPKDGVEVHAKAMLEDDKITFMAKRYFITKRITWTKIKK